MGQRLRDGHRTRILDAVSAEAQAGHIGSRQHQGGGDSRSTGVPEEQVIRPPVRLAIPHEVGHNHRWVGVVHRHRQGLGLG